MTERSPENRSSALTPRGVGRALAPASESEARPRRGQSEAPSSTIGVADVLHALRHWWWLAGPAGMALAIAAGVTVYLLMPPSYQAKAYLRIMEQRPQIVFNDLLSSRRFTENQVELIRSPIVLDRVVLRPEVAAVDELKLEPSKVGWVSKGMSVRSLGRSEIFELAFTALQPETAQTLTNAIVEEFMKLQQSADSAQRQKVIELLEMERVDRTREMQQLRDKAVTLAKQLPNTDPVRLDENKSLVVNTPLAAAQQDLAKATSTRAYLEAMLIAKKSSLAEKPTEAPAPTIDREVDEHPAVVDVMREITEKESLIEEYTGVAAPDYQQTKVKKLRDELAALEERLKKTRDDVRPSIAADITAALKSGEEAEILDLEHQIQAEVVLENFLRQDVQEQMVDREKQVGDTFDLEQARAAITQSEKVLNLIAERIVQLKTEGKSPDPVKLEQAAGPAELVVTRVIPKVLMAAGAGLLTPFVLAVLWERRLRRIAEATQISKEIKLDVLGEITTLPMRSMVPGRRGDARFEQHRSTFEESIDCLRTSLMLSEDFENVQVLVVASALSREGKTSLASQLAVSLANCCLEPTLLIDADMRDPDLHEMFGIPLEPGLAQVLDGKCTAADAIVTNWSRRVHLMPAGRLMKSPHVLLGGGALDRLLDEVRQHYRYIVIDAPPVLAASEAMFIARAGDGTLVCMMRDVSRSEQVRLACERLTAAGANLLGAVLSGVSPRTYASKYGNYGAYSKSYALNHSSLSDSTYGDSENGHAGEGFDAGRNS